MARGAGVRSEISNSVGRASGRAREEARVREDGGGRDGERRRGVTEERREGGGGRRGESRKVPQGNGYQNCACHYNFKAGFPRSFSLASPPVLPRPYTSVGWRQERRARERGKGRKRGRAGRAVGARTRERERETSAWEDAATPATRERVGHLFPPRTRASERARARAA